jgi:hypothetical protein
VEGNECPALKEALGWVFFRCTEIRESPEAHMFRVVPIAGKINTLRVRAPNRGFFAVLEATVHATRYHLTGDKRYYDLLSENLRLAEKCGGYGEKEAIRLLREAVASMGNKTEYAKP